MRVSQKSKCVFSILSSKKSNPALYKNASFVCVCACVGEGGDKVIFRFCVSCVVCVVLLFGVLSLLVDIVDSSGVGVDFSLKSALDCVLDTALNSALDFALDGVRFSQNVICDKPKKHKVVALLADLTLFI